MIRKEITQSKSKPNIKSTEQKKIIESCKENTQISYKGKPREE